MAIYVYLVSEDVKGKQKLASGTPYCRVEPTVLVAGFGVDY
jgi:hypothetical protein